MLDQTKLLRVPLWIWHMGARGGVGPPYSCPTWGVGGSFNITSACMSLPQAINLHSTLHWIALTLNKRFRKELKYILIHNRALQSFVWSSIALKIHISHFENWIFLFEISLQKVLAHFLLQKRWRNEGFNGTSDISRLWLNSYVYCDTLYNLVSV